MTENIIPGLEFAQKHMLTQKETLVLLEIIKKPLTLTELATTLDGREGTIHHIVSRLSIKRLIKAQKEKRENCFVYEFFPPQD